MSNRGRALLLTIGTSSGLTCSLFLCLVIFDGTWGTPYALVLSRVVVIGFWHGFIDYNYLSLNHQLIPITITEIASSNDYNYRKMTNYIVKFQVEVVMNWF